MAEVVGRGNVFHGMDVVAGKGEEEEKGKGREGGIGMGLPSDEER